MADAIIPIVLKRATLVDWQTINPILLWGEIGFIHENDSNSKPRIVIGDGVSTFDELYDNSRFLLTYEDLNQNYLNDLVTSLTALVTTESNARASGDIANGSLISGLTTEVNNLSDALDLTDGNLLTEITDRGNGDSALQGQIDSITGQLQLINGAVIYVGSYSGEAISRGDVLIADSGGILWKYDYTNPNHMNAVFGLAMSDVAIDTELSVHLFGMFIIDSALFDAGYTMFASQSVVGGVTKTQPTGINAMIIGYAIADYVINVSIEFANTDATLQGNIDGEITARENADITLQGNIDTLDTFIGGLVLEDANLQDNIDGEATTRGNADTTLQGNIDAIKEYLNLSIGVQNTTRNDNAILFWGQVPSAPETTGGRRRVYVSFHCHIKQVTISNWSLTAGTGENWSLYIRVNDTTDTLIQTIGVATNHRKWSNTSLNIELNAGDYFEIKEICPAWVTNPVGTQMSGNILIANV